MRDAFFSDCDIALSWHPANMNMVQSHAQVLYAIRALQVKDVKELYNRACSVAKGAAMMTGTTVDIRQELEQNLDRLLPMEYTEEEIAYAQSSRDVIPPAEQAEQKKKISL